MAGKLNIAVLRKCPKPAELAAKLREYGNDTGKMMGVIDVTEVEKRVNVSMVIRSKVAVKTIGDNGQEQSTTHDKSELIKFMVHVVNNGNKLGFLEVYNGGREIVKTIATFLAGDLTTDIVMDPINIDSFIALHQRLASKVGDGAAIVGATFKKYSPTEDVVGTVSSKFTSTADAIQFIESTVSDDENSPKIQSVKMAYKIGKPKVTISITPDSMHSFSCKPELADFVRDAIRELAGAPKLHANSAPPVDTEEEGEIGQ